MRKIRRETTLATRVAFLMAWHPRLGECSLISRCANKDIARLILQKYCMNNEYFPIAVKMKEGKPMHEMKRYFVSINTTPQFKECTLNVFQTPELRVAFPLLEPEDRRRAMGKVLPQTDGILPLFPCSKSGERFFDWMKGFEQLMIRQSSGVLDNTEFHSCIKLNQQGQINAKWTQQTKVFTGKSDPIDILDAINTKMLGPMARIRLLLRLSYVWKMGSNRAGHRTGCRWDVDQILIQSSPQPTNECLFMDDQMY